MILKETSLKGAFVLELDPIEDNRGFFSRALCVSELEDVGLPFKLAQANISHSIRKNTLRGLHYQSGKSAEIKIFRCIAGSILDVIIDLRSNSPTFGQHFKIELSSNNGRSLYIPKGFAHGFLTLEEDTKVFYLVSESYSAEDSRYVRWDDPFFGIEWPVNDPVLSNADKNIPDYQL